MKYIYIDESQAGGEGDVFTMCGLMVDAHNIHTKIAGFEAKLNSLFAMHPGEKLELKTSSFINGKKGWRNINLDERKRFLTEICQLVVDNKGSVFAIGLSLKSFKDACSNDHGQPFSGHWQASALFISCLVQKKMQGKLRRKGNTNVFIDNNPKEIADFQDALDTKDKWFDGLYRGKVKRRGKKYCVPSDPSDRFDQILNTASPIKSDYSVLIQVADAICYVYRRYLELQTASEEWPGERVYYEGLVRILEPCRQKIGHCPSEPSCKFYKESCHKSWRL